MGRFNRRSMLGYSLCGAGAALAGLPDCADAAFTANGYGGAAERWIIDDTSAVADTESGKVIGYVRNGIRIFKGIPYGEIRAPDGRWMRASKVRPWAGKRSSRAEGVVCPPDVAGNSNAAQGALDEVLMQQYDAEPTRPNEECLNLNVWTPGTDNKKRQVLFYCHGGGFHNGSSLMAAKWEAHNLAKYGDVVVVSMNHRLNVLGFLDLTAYGRRFADSANIGMLDVVDALKWVRTNIANFGGDPAKVMIIGHSGGGAKVLTLLAMPEAKGLFNRAAAHSPGFLPLSTPQKSKTLAASFLKSVNISPGNIDALHRIRLETLLRAAGAFTSRFDMARARFDQWNTDAADWWLPVVDGRTVLYQPTLPTVASDVPLLTGTVLHELYGALGHPEYMQMQERQARDILRRFFGAQGDGIYDVYRELFPDANPYELSAMARATGDMRAYCVKIAERRAALNAAPTYNYWFQWQAKIFEGRALAHHEIEMPLVFMNTDAIPTVTGATAEARALSLEMADAWLAFARTGDPNTKALPHWNPVTPRAMTSMVFNNSCRVDKGSDLAAIELAWKSRFPQA